MTSDPLTTITLRALEGEPLKNELIRRMVEATAHAIAERQGVSVAGVATEPVSISVTLRAGRIPAMGFAAELRRLTTAWYTAKYGETTLWGDPPRDSDDSWRGGADEDDNGADTWKQA